MNSNRFPSDEPRPCEARILNARKVSNVMTPDTRLIQQPTSRRSFLRAAGLGVAALGATNLLAACGAGAGVSKGPKAAGALSKPTPFHISSARIDNYLLDMVALDQNIYGRYNLEVGKLLYPQSGVQGMQLLAAGASNAMLQDMMLVLAGYANAEKGKRPQIVGVRVPETTYSIVVGKGSWPAASATFAEKMQALKGKKVGVTAVGAGADQQLRLALQAAGMQYDDVTHLGIGNQIPAGAAQLKAGRIDAYVGFTYTVGELVAALAGGSVYIQFSDPSVPAILSQQQVDVDIVREDFLAANPDAVKAWLAANTEAKDWVLANKAAAANLLNTESLGGKGAQIATSYIEHYATSLVPKIQPGWKATKAGVDLMIKIGTTEGVIKPGQVSYEQLVPEFARA